MQNLWNVIKTAVQYHAIKGAIVIKVIAVLLPALGYAPWTPDQQQAVSNAVDAVVGALAIFAVSQAHNTIPPAAATTTKPSTKG